MYYSYHTTVQRYTQVSTHSTQMLIAINHELDSEVHHIDLVEGDADVHPSKVQ